MQRIKVGLVGCGNISSIYLTNLTTTFSHIIDLIAVCDIIPSRADAAAKQYDIPKTYYTDDAIMSDPDIDLILNLTPPAEHAPVNLLALAAGKHAYCEKPLATTRQDGEAQITLAKHKNLLLGGAPDTFLGGGLQTARKLIDDGWIGTPILATAMMLGHGPESWHPDPEFFYKKGAGPMFDMGPYYLTALINLMGPVKSVSASTAITFPERTITSQPHCGEIIHVEVPTRIVGLLNFESGATATLITSFDIWTDQGSYFIIYGTKGSLRIPDPNNFSGPIELLRHGQNHWEPIPVIYPHQENSRGLGLADFCAAILENRTPRASYNQTFHVLDLMCAFHEAAIAHSEITLKPGFTRQPPLSL